MKNEQKRFSKKQQPLWLALLLSLSINTAPVWSADLFAGITGIEVLMPLGNSQSIKIIADLPFDYQWLKLSDHQIMIRFLNAKLSSDLIRKNGALIFDNNQAIESVKLLNSVDGAIEAIILTGEYLGEKEIAVEGGTLVGLNTEEAEQLQSLFLASEKTGTDKLPIASTSSEKNQNGFQIILPSRARKTDHASSQTRMLSDKASKPLIRLNRPAIQADVNGELLTLEPTSPIAPVSLKSTVQPKPANFSQNPIGMTPVEIPPMQETIEQITLLPIDAPRAAQPSTQHVKKSASLPNPLTLAKFFPEATPQQKQAQTRQDLRQEEIEHQKTALPPTQKPKRTQSSQYANKKSADKLTVHFPDAPVKPAFSKNLATDFTQSVPDNQSLEIAVASSPSSVPLKTSMADFPVKPNIALSEQRPVTALSNSSTESYGTLALNSPVPVSQQAHNALQSALSAYRSQEYAKAEQILNEALRSQPEASRATLYAARAEIAIKQRQYPNAELDYAKTYRLKPLQYALRYAETLILSGKRQPAISVLKSYITDSQSRFSTAEQASSLGKAHYILGTLFEDAGDTADALIELQKAERLIPSDADIQYNLGLAYELSAQRNLAKMHYAKAAQISPDAGDVQNALRRLTNQGN